MIRASKNSSLRKRQSNPAPIFSSKNGFKPVAGDLAGAVLVAVPAAVVSVPAVVLATRVDMMSCRAYDYSAA
jgi:hypothetical protein